MSSVSAVSELSSIVCGNGAISSSPPSTSSTTPPAPATVANAALLTTNGTAHLPSNMPTPTTQVDTTPNTVITAKPTSVDVKPPSSNASGIAATSKIEEEQEQTTSSIELESVGGCGNVEPCLSDPKTTDCSGIAAAVPLAATVPKIPALVPIARAAAAAAVIATSIADDKSQGASSIDKADTANGASSSGNTDRASGITEPPAAVTETADNAETNTPPKNITETQQPPTETSTNLEAGDKSDANSAKSDASSQPKVAANVSETDTKHQPSQDVLDRVEPMECDIAQDTADAAVDNVVTAPSGVVTDKLQVSSATTTTAAANNNTVTATTTSPRVAAKKPRLPIAEKTPRLSQRRKHALHNQDHQQQQQQQPPQKRSSKSPAKLSPGAAEKSPTAAAAAAAAGGGRWPQRSRAPTHPYQVPIPEFEPLPRALKPTPPRPTDNKLVVFFKNEFLAVRNEDNSFFVCQAMQNVHKGTRKVKVRWLTGDSAGVYTADFYDAIDFESILTSLTLKRLNGGRFSLDPAESSRADNILRRALQAEQQGVAPGVGADTHHPDGLDISLYNDESQLDRSSASVESAGDSATSTSSVTAAVSAVPASATPRGRNTSTTKSPKSTKARSKRSRLTTSPIATATGGKTSTSGRSPLKRGAAASAAASTAAVSSAATTTTAVVSGGGGKKAVRASPKRKARTVASEKAAKQKVLAQAFARGKRGESAESTGRSHRSSAGTTGTSGRGDQSSSTSPTANHQTSPTRAGRKISPSTGGRPSRTSSRRK